MIRGSITNLAPGASALVMLQAKDSNVTQGAPDVKKNGSFEIRDVSPGAYTLVAAVTDAIGTKLARQTVQVGSANVDGLRLTPQPGGWIHGYLRLESKIKMGRLNPAQVSLWLLPAEGRDDVSSARPIGEGFSPLAQLNADGSCECKDVPP